MKRGPRGQIRTTSSGGEAVHAFVPNRLPPEPALDLAILQNSLEKALLALGRLDSLSVLLPDPHLFLYPYIRKEAVLSSQIEGTRSTLADLLLYELNKSPGVLLDDVAEVSNYVVALEHGMSRLDGGFPLCTRLVREIHEKLLSGGRDGSQMPGEFRKSQNWIGGTRPGNAQFVPPPPEAIEDCMADLERFYHSQSGGMPALLRAGIAHAQFETIHPFLDGNGRIGRLMITLALYQAGIVREPLLYLSFYFKQHRDRYYELLNEVRKNGDWEAWAQFFLDGVEQTARGAVSTAQRLLRLFQQDRARLQQEGRKSGSALRVHQVLQRRPITSLQFVADHAELSFPAASRSMKLLERIGIVRELTGNKRNRIFGYQQYISVLSQESDPLTQA